MATKPSKFSSLFQNNEEELVIEDETKALVVAPTVEEAAAPQPVLVETPSSPEPGSDAPRRTGRPATGKKSDPNYRQVTAYVRKDLYKNVSDALYDESRGRPDAKRKEFSELVDELLEQWWQNRTNKP